MILNSGRQINVSDLPADAAEVNVGDIYIRTAGDVSGVTLVKDTLGVIFLGLVALFLVVALARSQARNRELINQTAGAESTALKQRPIQFPH